MEDNVQGSWLATAGSAPYDGAATGQPPPMSGQFIATHLTCVIVVRHLDPSNMRAWVRTNLLPRSPTLISQSGHRFRCS